MANAISATFVLSVLPKGKIVPKPFVISLGVEYVTVFAGHWGILANLPSTTGCLITIECYDLFLGCIKFDFSNMDVSKAEVKGEVASPVGSEASQAKADAAAEELPSPNVEDDVFAKLRKEQEKTREQVH